MKTQIKIYEDLKMVVKFFSKQLKFDKFVNKTGRKLAVAIDEIIALSLFKQTNNIATKKSIYRIFKNNLNCSYKTLVVNMNRWSILASAIIEGQFWIMYYNRRPNDGIGLNGISPKERMEKLGVCNSEKIANFPCLILEDFFQPFMSFFNIENNQKIFEEKSQNVLTNYLFT